MREIDAPATFAHLDSWHQSRLSLWDSPAGRRPSRSAASASPCRCQPRLPSARPARAENRVKAQGTTCSTGVIGLGCTASSRRSGMGGDSTNRRTGTWGMMWSTSCAAVCPMRRDRHGQPVQRQKWQNLPVPAASLRFATGADAQRCSPSTPAQARERERGLVGNAEVG